MSIKTPLFFNVLLFYTDQHPYPTAQIFDVMHKMSVNDNL